MSEIQKELPYKDKLIRTVGLTNTLTIPVWGIMAAVAAILSLFGAIDSIVENDLVKFFGYFGLCFGYAMIYFSGSVLSGLTKDCRILLTSDGLTLPEALAFCQGVHAFIYWGDIKKSEVEGSFLQLHLDRKVVKLNLNCLTARDCEQLLMSIMLLTHPGGIEESLRLYKESLEQTPLLSDFTRIWENELSSRYNSTAYCPLLPGQKVREHLEIIRQLSFGGWSAVYLCQDRQVRVRVLKELVIPAQASAGQRAKAEELFVREAGLLMRIQHPNIVSIHDHFIEEGRHYLLLDYVAGQTLRQLVQMTGRQHELDVLEYARILAAALAYLHDLHPPIIHRDLAPDNVVIDEEGKLSLIDFGAANEMIGTATGTTIGKHRYIAPEQFKGRAGKQSDLYALGGTLYFLLTAREPEPLSQSICNNVPGIAVSAALNQLIADLTAINVDERLGSAHELLERIEAIKY